MSKNSRAFQTKSGEVFKLRPVDEVLLASVVKQVEGRRPRPPVEVIDGVEVPNEAHPGYMAALENFQMTQSLYVIAVYIQFGVSLKLTEEELEEAKEMQANRELVQPGALENKFLNYIHITSICPTMEELSALVDAIKNINNPSAEEVQLHLNAFRSDVTGPADNGHQDTPIGNTIPVRLHSLHSLQSGNLGGV